MTEKCVTPVDPSKFTTTITIGAPITNADFYGTASGTFGPTFGTIRCEFWSADPRPQNPGECEPAAEVWANADRRAGRLIWLVTLDLSNIPSTTEGFLRVTHTIDGETPAVAEVTSLNWTNPNQPPVTGPGPQIQITRPEAGDELPQLFPVCVRAPHRPGWSVRVTLLDRFGNSVPLVSPAVHLLGDVWVAAVASSKADDGFTVVAELLDANGTKVTQTAVNGLKIGNG